MKISIQLENCTDCTKLKIQLRKSMETRERTGEGNKEGVKEGYEEWAQGRGYEGGNDYEGSKSNSFTFISVALGPSF